MITSEEIRLKRLDESHWEKMIRSANVLLNKRLLIDDTPSLTVIEMTSMCRKVKKEKRLDIIIIAKQRNGRLGIVKLKWLGNILDLLMLDIEKIQI